MGSTPISGMVCHKVTIRPRPGFSGQFRFLTTCPGKNCSALQFSRDAHLSRFWLGVPDMSLFSHICSRMLTLRWLKISSDFIFVYEKKSLAARAPSLRLGPAGEHTTLPRPTSRTPTARACGARTLQFAPTAFVQDCGAQIMVTFVCHT